MAEEVRDQRYDESGDAVVVDGQWLCEHQNEDGTPAPARVMVDDGKSPMGCQDCGTVWVAWTRGVRRLAKPVVERM